MLTQTDPKPKTPFLHPEINFFRAGKKKLKKDLHSTLTSGKFAFEITAIPACRVACLHRIARQREQNSFPAFGVNQRNSSAIRCCNFKRPGSVGSRPLVGQKKNGYRYTDYGIIGSKDGASYEKLVIFLYLCCCGCGGIGRLGQHGNKRSNGLPAFAFRTAEQTPTPGVSALKTEIGKIQHFNF